MKNLMMICAVAALVAVSGQSEASVPVRYRLASSAGVVPLTWTQVGLSSWYGSESAGKTASGELYDMNKLTAAHRTLPFNSRIKVTNLKNGKEVTVRVNDRGPNVPGRLLDLSRAAAQKLGFLGSGRAPVRVTVVRYPKGYIAQPSPSLLASCVRPVK
ncbi:MAG TPA: septal ring lytic transglycosylase RlpA family protein [Terriglobia bacterium]|nr:septal ring lytic transglycosylase RlpA family protein [Terriglobia bacterium]